MAEQQTSWSGWLARWLAMGAAVLLPTMLLFALNIFTPFAAADALDRQLEFRWIGWAEAIVLVVVAFIQSSAVIFLVGRVAPHFLPAQQR
ncbi:hypothetical protein VPG91_24820 [Nitrospirillum amazonense]|uniref:hypothetical protein n=1 Tax=Nitrospirillum amazonense TaxID=28077 RepID=UPI002DD44735|nr:hypothetical protein [Nitrospirillum amazonense]MEC4594246.1 hypothetical protein [Nitrospirillum amazonense]